MSIRETLVKQIRARAMEPLSQGDVRWQAPSNIALVKYWGKHGVQLPMNPSISFTLSACYSDTAIKFKRKSGPSTTVDLTFQFHDQDAPEFAKRIKTYFESILDLCPFLTQYDLAISSSNSFPHSAGIASSASGFCALALCLTTMEDMLYGDLDDDEAYRLKASLMARLGSGSASRSVFGQAAWWGESSILANSSDEYSIDCSTLLHPTFQNFVDDILVVSSDAKSVSSSAGHHLMEFHPYREGRMTQVQRHLTDMKTALQTGDTERFGSIVESEALSLHALMLSSSPGYFLINGRSIKVINKIRAFRQSTHTPVYFTLDAGPNIHLLYPQEYSSVVREFISEELSDEVNKTIFDKMGTGPVQLD